MRLDGHKNRWILTLSAFYLILFTLSGCAKVGPRSISMGRASYNEAINRTEDEQLLMSIVRGRYGETSTLLAVSGVAANVRFNTNAGVQAGFGPSDNYVGNLIPFSGGLAYEENPTITYAPIKGDQYIREMMSPIPLDLLLLVVRSTTTGSRQFAVLVSRVNDIRNPHFLDGPFTETDPKFIRFVELSDELHDAGVLDLLKDPAEEIVFDIVLSDYAPQYTEMVSEYLNLLDLEMPTHKPDDIVIPALRSSSEDCVRYGP